MDTQKNLNVTMMCRLLEKGQNARFLEICKIEFTQNKKTW